MKEVHVYVSLFLYSCHRDEKMETETMHLRGGGIAEGFLDKNNIEHLYFCKLSW